MTQARVCHWNPEPEQDGHKGKHHHPIFGRDEREVLAAEKRLGF